MVKIPFEENIGDKTEEKDVPKNRDKKREKKIVSKIRT